MDGVTVLALKMWRVGRTQLFLEVQDDGRGPQFNAKQWSVSIATLFLLLLVWYRTQGAVDIDKMMCVGGGQTLEKWPLLLLLLLLIWNSTYTLVAQAIIYGWRFASFSSAFSIVEDLKDHLSSIMIQSIRASRQRWVQQQQRQQKKEKRRHHECKMVCRRTTFHLQ